MSVRSLRNSPTMAVLATVLALSAGVDSRAAEPPPATVPMRFDVQGSADVRTGIRGQVAIAGTFDGTYTPGTGKFVGGFTLTPTLAHITVLGLFPATAETDWIFTEPVTGEWRDGVLSLRAAARIHHAHLFAFGVPIAGGGNCATRRASVMELRSSATTPIADPLAGGTLTTTGQGFTISALAGCGALDGVLSAIAAGGGNQATLKLTPTPSARS